MKLQKFVSELSRRNVFKTAGAYAVVGWLIIQIAVTVKEPLHLPVWIDTVAIIAVIIGFPFVLIASWIFELTPDGFMKTDEIDKQRSIANETGKKINRITIGALSVVIVLLLTERLFFASSNFFDELEPSIAVLPFVNMSSDSENEYFSDGLSVELLNGLARIEEIKVAGRTSSFNFKNKNASYDEISTLLNVDHILEGSVRKSGNQIRITATLIRARDGFELWSSVYDRELSGIFAIQDEVSRNVIRELKLKLLPSIEISITQPTEILGAYDAYLRANQFVTSRRPVDIDSSIVYLKKAIALDSDFALAYARLAYAYGLQHEYSFAELSLVEPLMRDNIDAALLRDPMSAEAYEALGSLYRRKAYDQSIRLPSYDTALNYKSVEAFERANELLPNNSSILSNLANAYSSVNDIDKYVQFNKRAYEIDPLNSRIVSNYAISLTFVDRNQEALQIFDQLIRTDTTFVNAYARKASIQAYDLNELDNGFITAYECYMLYGYDPSLFEGMLIITQTVGLFDFSNVLKNISLEHIESDDQLVLNFAQAYTSKDFDKLREMKNDLKHLFEPLGDQTFRAFNLQEEIYKGNYEKALELLLPTADWQDGPFIGPVDIEDSWAILYLKTNQKERSDSVFNEIIKKNELESGFSNKREEEAIRLNKVDAKIYYDSLYFHNSWGMKYSFLRGANFNPRYIVLDELKVLENIKKDRNRMRNNIIAYLKKKGAWDDSWEVNDTQLVPTLMN